MTDTTTGTEVVTLSGFSYDELLELPDFVESEFQIMLHSARILLLRIGLAA